MSENVSSGTKNLKQTNKTQFNVVKIYDQFKWNDGNDMNDPEKLIEK